MPNRRRRFNLFIQEQRRCHRNAPRLLRMLIPAIRLRRAHTSGGAFAY